MFIADLLDHPRQLLFAVKSTAPLNRNISKMKILFYNKTSKNNFKERELTHSPKYSLKENLSIAQLNPAQSRQTEAPEYKTLTLLRLSCCPKQQCQIKMNN